MIIIKKGLKGISSVQYLGNHSDFSDQSFVYVFHPILSQLFFTKDSLSILLESLNLPYFRSSFFSRLVIFYPNCQTHKGAYYRSWYGFDINKQKCTKFSNKDKTRTQYDYIIIQKNNALLQQMNLYKWEIPST